MCRTARSRKDKAAALDTVGALLGSIDTLASGRCAFSKALVFTDTGESNVNPILADG